jgi:hypothetical protein
VIRSNLSNIPTAAHVAQNINSGCICSFVFAGQAAEYVSVQALSLVTCNSCPLKERAL